ncbi:MAG TPA: radical SAM protein [Phycisphaerae bacterium]|nr:radical SAM protein [Phycisphaerae bacterium]
MKLLLINPFNPLINLADVKSSRWNRYRIWKPLGLLVLSALTPKEWDVTIIDENIGRVDYNKMDTPDFVGISAFTSQAPRAYELAAEFRAKKIPVVMGGIHATMCTQEAAKFVDSIVTGEAEIVWPQVLQDVIAGRLQSLYHGGHIDMAHMPIARHDLLTKGYAFGSIQTTRGCPLNCKFCSVTAFNGNKYRNRPIENVIEEFRAIPEKRVLIVDDNLIGITPAHIERAKELFRAMIAANIRKKWMAQVTINFADDEELLTLAEKAGCSGVFIGFESSSATGLAEVGKKFNMLKSRNFHHSIRHIHKHKILVVGSFIMGLDADKPGIGKQIAAAGKSYGVDILNVLFLTPLPGTHLWNDMCGQDRILLCDFPADWKYYTLGFPTAKYNNFSFREILHEMKLCDGSFYSRKQILLRAFKNFIYRHQPFVSLISNLSFRHNAKMAQKGYLKLLRSRTSLVT